MSCAGQSNECCVSVRFVRSLFSTAEMIGAICLVACSLHIYCCEPYPQLTQIVEPENPRAAVIVLHGAGENGLIMKETVEKHLGDFSEYPNLRMIFPTAIPKAFYPFPWNGQIVNLWYGIDKLSIDGVVNVTEITESASIIERWIKEQVASGIPRNKICVVGFSSGAGMAIHFGYEYMKDIACVGALSGYIPTVSNLYKELTTRENEIGEDLPPLYMSAASMDFVIQPQWTLSTLEAFKSAGVAVDFNYQWAASHLMTTSDVKGLFKFVQQHLS